MTFSGSIFGALLSGLLVFLVTPQAWADDAIGMELNKVEPVGEGCRIYMVFSNETAGTIESYKPDLVFFDNKGVIADRLVVEGGPLAAGKTRVRLFDVEKLGCNAIGRVLLNDVRTCAGREAAACLAMTRTSSLGDVPFIK